MTRREPDDNPEWTDGASPSRFAPLSIVLAGQEMDLKEFLTQTIVQIMEGVKEAQEQVGGDALVNPPAQRDGNVVAKEDQTSWRYVHKVEFDVAVTVSTGTEAKAGAGLMVAAIGIGGQAQTNTENTAISRIRFEVPIAFPTVSDQHARTINRPAMGEMR